MVTGTTCTVTFSYGRSLAVLQSKTEKQKGQLLEIFVKFDDTKRNIP
jgi:hypothetical protein